MRQILCLLALVTVTVAAAGCLGPVRNNLPPAEMIMHPGPGVGGPGPGVLSQPATVPMPPPTSQVFFVGSDGMVVHWDVGMPGTFASEPLVVPGRENFPQGAIYRLKLTNIPAHPGVELYPTLEVGPGMPRTLAFLAHNAIPVQFTPEDFAQVMSGNFVTKVIYLPDPEFQELALPGAMAGVETLVSTRLDPGIDPIVEANNRGSILAIVRLGNKDLQMPGDMMMGGMEQVVPASYQDGDVESGEMAVPPGTAMFAPGADYGLPAGVPMGAPVSTVPSNYISGLTGPAYGMPMSGTPIGLPGPPHVPLGIPAGLRRHTIANHTCVKVPPPTSAVRLDVRQDPGMHYPAPANHAWIVEQTLPRAPLFHQPPGDKHEVIRPGYVDDCPQ